MIHDLKAEKTELRRQMKALRAGFTGAARKKADEAVWRQVLALPAFEACVKEAHVEAVMGAYNAVNGVPACCNSRLLKDILRDEWGFEGHVVSDCGAIEDISENHKYAPDKVHAAAYFGSKQQIASDDPPHHRINVHPVCRIIPRVEAKSGIFVIPRNDEIVFGAIHRLARFFIAELRSEADKISRMDQNIAVFIRIIDSVKFWTADESYSVAHEIIMKRRTGVSATVCGNQYVGAVIKRLGNRSKFELQRPLTQL